MTMRHEDVTTVVALVVVLVISTPVFLSRRHELVRTVAMVGMIIALMGLGAALLDTFTSARHAYRRERQMNLSVTLVANGINVTARNEGQALEYLREDAQQFCQDWNYELEDTFPTDDEAATGAYDCQLDVSVDEAEGRGERIWTGSARFTVVLPGEDEGDALLRASALLAA